MRRADRLFRIVQHLRGGRLTTADRLADAMEVSARTIYRDIADLQASGVPIEGEAGLGYVMQGGYDVPPLMFSKAEIAALVAGARLVQAWGGLAMGQAAEEALVKIEAVVPEVLRDAAARVEVHSIAWDGPDGATRARIDRVDAAIEARERLEVRYVDQDGSQTTRVIRPLGLWFWGKVWTVVAWCEMRDDFRMFRLDRIAGAEGRGPFRPERDKSLRAFYASGPAPDPPSAPSAGGGTSPQA